MVRKFVENKLTRPGPTFHRYKHGNPHEAPEMHTDLEYDAFLADVFSAGATRCTSLPEDKMWLAPAMVFGKEVEDLHPERMECHCSEVKCLDLKLITGAARHCLVNLNLPRVGTC